MVLGDVMLDGGIVVCVWWKFFIVCIWFGVLIMMFGGFILFFDCCLWVGVLVWWVKKVVVFVLEVVE